MTKERFAEILTEYGYTAGQIEALWNSRLSDDLDEERVRETAKFFAPKKDDLIN